MFAANIDHNQKLSLEKNVMLRKYKLDDFGAFPILGWLVHQYTYALQQIFLAENVFLTLHRLVFWL